jgi:hypothetical protein
MEKVIFDTQVARNPEARKFLGNRKELKQFAKISEIIFPDIVIEEIKNQKRRNLESKKQSFLDNPFHWLRDLDHDETRNFDIESHISELEKNETLKYNVIKLSDYSVLEQMKELALKKQPPFEPNDNTDKGFKDACIYFTTLEYLQSIPDKSVFICCKDGRLKEAFQKHPNIIVVKSFDEFIQQGITQFYGEYFIEKLKSEVLADISKDNIIDYWKNINENHVLLIQTDTEKYAVEVDAGEIVAFEKVSTYSDTIKSLINARAFSTTHSSVENLMPYLHFLSDNEILKILNAVRTNEQINWIIGDEDVKQFITTLYDSKKEIMPSDLSTDIKLRLEERA